jgi:class 3 adenylate cyclase/tetratricopeptide (TPR) repeat protein
LTIGNGLLLLVVPLADSWVWTLTDGAALATSVVAPVRSVEAPDGADGLSLGTEEPRARVADAGPLLPAELGDILATIGGGALTLQLDAALQRLCWERAQVGDQPLGQRFALSRQARGFAGAHRVVRRRGGNQPLVVRRLQDADDARTGAQAPPSWSMADGEVDVLIVPRGEPAVRLPTTPAEPGSLAVVIIDGPGNEDAPLSWLALAAAVILCDGAESASPAWQEVLLDGLEAGCTVAEAARRVRCGLPAAAGASIRVFGDAHFAVREAVSPSDAQQRQVSTLAADIVGSTNLIETWGHERYSQALSGFYAMCARIASAHGGSTEEAQGDDCVISYFGHPRAIEHAASAAVQAALELVEHVAELGIRIRAGVASGRVAIEHGRPVGVSIHQAARLQKLAEPGGVLISDSTRELIGQRFDLERLGAAHQLKGLKGVHEVWRVHGRVEDADDGAAALAGRDLPIVGRDQELQTLLAEWRAVCAGQSRFVVVEGEAGIGKTRLVRELRSRIAGMEQRVLVCRCHADRRTSAFFALSESLRQMLSLTLDGSAEQQYDDLVNRLSPCTGTAQELALLAELLGLKLPAERQVPGLPPELWRERTLELLLRWFADAASETPVCVVVEDLHWVDPSTAEFLRRLTSRLRSSPILVVATRRIEIAATWDLEQAQRRITLTGLVAEAARQMVRNLGRSTALPEGLVRALAARSDGVPLFVEESVAMATDATGAVPSAWAGGQDIAVPSRLQDLLAARLDMLGEAKPLAQLASVLGRWFPARLLAALVARHRGDGAAVLVPLQLKALEAAGMLVRRAGVEPEPKPALHGDIGFRHALQREAAYQSIWERDRRQMHLIVAELLTAQDEEPAPELLAYHLGAAGRPTEALAHWQAAARQAVARSANDEAKIFYGHALDALRSLPEHADRDRAELRLQLAFAARCIAADGYGADQVEDIYLRAEALAIALGDRQSRLKAELGLNAWHFMRADFDRAARMARRAMKEASQLDEPMASIQSRWALALTEWQRGNLAHAVTQMDQCLALYQPGMHRPAAVQDPAVMCLCYSAWGQWERGLHDDSLLRIDRAVALARRLGHRFSEALSLGFAASVHHFRGDVDRALQAATQAIDLCEQQGYSVWLAHARMIHGRLQCEIGQVAAGLAEMQLAHRQWVASGAQVTRTVYLCWQAEGSLLDGRPRDAVTALDEALSLANRSGERFFEPELLRILAAAGRASGQAGLQAQAPLQLQRAHASARALGMHGLALRAAIDMARTDASDPEASQRVREALAQNIGGHGIRDIGDAERLIAMPQ